jgi:hypothetical protein
VGGESGHAQPRNAPGTQGNISALTELTRSLAIAGAILAFAGVQNATVQAVDAKRLREPADIKTVGNSKNR